MQRAGRTRRIAEQPGGIDLGPVGNDVDVLLRTLVARGPRLGEREGAADGIRFSDGRQDAAGGIDRVLDLLEEGLLLRPDVKIQGYKVSNIIPTFTIIELLDPDVARRLQLAASQTN